MRVMTESHKQKLTPQRTWRWIGLLSWGLLACAYLAFFLIELRLDFNQLLVPCEGPNCNWMAISATEVDVLGSWGLSTSAYALFMTGAAVFTVAVYWFLGGLILWQQGTTRFGLAVSITLLVIPISAIADADNLAAIYPNLLLPSILLSELGTVVMLLFFYLFPNGRFFPRWAVIPLVISILSFGIISVLNILGNIPMSGVSFQLVGPILTSIVLLAGIFQILRYFRDSTPIERQQTKWVVLGIIIFLLGFPVWFLFFGGGLSFAPGQARLLGLAGGWVLSNLLMIALPITITFAILRYRLWDIDLIIRRTLIYGLLTILLVLIYFGGVTLLQNLFSALTGQQSALAVVISTLAIAALFNPLRLRTQEFIDRRFFRRKYDAEQALNDFAISARSETDIMILTTRLGSIINQTIQPETVSFWLKQKGD